MGQAHKERKAHLSCLSKLLPVACGLWPVAFGVALYYLAPDLSNIPPPPDALNSNKSSLCQSKDPPMPKQKL
ncbi:hypothetical protein LYNGBM3L_53710 [Moorena producens 3L]|uniref:Uncharacterized protein n=1 Tax=Moorena producens 3L TaxID=489825 RepID=F4XZ12_9CYAN|nr:hypothetical protein LYNGBM3L_53710 [Moorena producens 3L]